MILLVFQYHMTRDVFEKQYHVPISRWVLADAPLWQQKVLDTTFAQVGELLIEKIGDVQVSHRALTKEEQEALLVAFKSFLEIHTLLHAGQTKGE